MPASAANLRYLLQEINTLLRQLTAYGPLPPAAVAAQRLQWVYDTVRLAGSTLGPTDVQLLLRYDQQPLRPLPAGEAEAVRALATAFDQVQTWATDRTHRLDLDDLLELHERAAWRGLTDELHRQPANAERQRALEDLAGWYRVVTFEKHPVLAATELYLEVIGEKAFGPANQEVMAALLLQYHLARHSFPPVSVRATDVEAYRSALARTRPGEPDALAEYFARQAIYALETALRALRGEANELDTGWEQALTRMEARLQGLPPAVPTPRASVPQRLQDSVTPLLQLLLTRLARFDRFFKRQNHCLWLRQHGIEQTVPATMYLEFLPAVNADQVESLSLQWHWMDGVSLENFDLKLEFVIGFETSQYELWFPGRINLLLVKPYTTALDEAEQRRIVDTIGEYLVQLLEERLG